MMNHYTMEKLIEYQQNEIELKARQMWKWLNSQDCSTNRCLLPLLLDGGTSKN